MAVPEAVNEGPPSESEKKRCCCPLSGSPLQEERPAAPHSTPLSATPAQTVDLFSSAAPCGVGAGGGAGGSLPRGNDDDVFGAPSPVGATASGVHSIDPHLVDNGFFSGGAHAAAASCSGADALGDLLHGDGAGDSVAAGPSAGKSVARKRVCLHLEQRALLYVVAGSEARFCLASLPSCVCRA